MDDTVLWFRCLEGLFDTWGAFGFGFVGNLSLGGPAPIGARKAALSEKVEPYMQEIALSEQVCSCLALNLETQSTVYRPSVLTPSHCYHCAESCDFPAALCSYYCALVDIRAGVIGIQCLCRDMPCL